MVRPPRFATGTFRSENGQASVELHQGIETQSLNPGTAVEVLIWDQSARSVYELIAHTQELPFEETAQGYSGKGALHAGVGPSDPNVNAPFLSRIPADA